MDGSRVGHRPHLLHANADGPRGKSEGASSERKRNWRQRRRGTRTWGKETRRRGQHSRWGGGGPFEVGSSVPGAARRMEGFLANSSPQGKGAAAGDQSPHVPGRGRESSLELDPVFRTPLPPDQLPVFRDGEQRS
ncbi:hypothetical protein chiPu_0030487 [Chiloscyllium punctatum]|uniref:Uncharacterized protein n=1 Tax=Chiloscyllium punctatum TaxID=137246 RepID=A0A401TUU4_CHIPU|nr:hypothetical protein [Chiloscyllium punctatum]